MPVLLWLGHSDMRAMNFKRVENVSQGACFGVFRCSQRLHRTRGWYKFFRDDRMVEMH